MFFPACVSLCVCITLLFICDVGIDCGAPDQVVNGNIDFTTTSLGSVATYTCNPGDILQGNPRRTCEQNGQWSGSPPTCTRESIYALFIEHKTKCVNPLRTSRYTCVTVLHCA